MDTCTCVTAINPNTLECRAENMHSNMESTWGYGKEKQVYIWIQVNTCETKPVFTFAVKKRVRGHVIKYILCDTCCCCLFK